MGFIKNTVSSAKGLGKGVWIAAIIVPGGLTAIAAWLVVKGAYKSLRKKND